MIDQVDVIEVESARLAEVVRRGPVDATVAACPGWDLGALAAHVGWVQRWARLAVTTSAPPDEDAIDEPRGDLVGWLEAGSAALVAALRDLDPDGPTWHPFPVPLLGRVWPRRQAQEVLVHRWDAEHAVGAETPIPPELAASGIDEYFEVVVPRIVTRDGRAIPDAPLTVRCPDVGRAWFVDGGGRFPALTTERASSAVVEAAAADVLLALWGRRPLPAGAASEATGAWLRFGGN